MGKRPRAKYTLEFKLEALRQIAARQSVAHGAGHPKKTALAVCRAPCG
jgi:polysaccharide deacetylase 2 family uncharacterized protein YibQ